MAQIPYIVILLYKCTVLARSLNMNQLTLITVSHCPQKVYWRSMPSMHLELDTVGVATLLLIPNTPLLALLPPHLKCHLI
jgi:hypothetical protein